MLKLDILISHVQACFKCVSMDNITVTGHTKLDDFSEGKYACMDFR